MKLTQSQVQQVQGQIDSQAVPDDHPTAAQLETVFGGHTFFLGPQGLHVVERTPTAESEQAALLVKVASWGDDQMTQLLPQGAELEGEIELAPDGEDPAA